MSTPTPTVGAALDTPEIPDLTGLCDHCGGPVDEDDQDDCEPDEDGYCILCGRQIGDTQ